MTPIEGTNKESTPGHFRFMRKNPSGNFPRRSDPVWEMFVAKDGFRADVSGKDPVLLMGSIDRL